MMGPIKLRRNREYERYCIMLCILIMFSVIYVTGAYILGFLDKQIVPFLQYCLVLLVTFCIIANILNKKRYYPCPNCDKSINVYEDWQCNYCNQFQKKETFISDKCIHCGRRLGSFYCEHCHEEIKL